jgi:hypothetical protein
MNAFHELVQKKKITITNTFYIIDIFHDTEWIKNVKSILLNIGATKIIYSEKELPKEQSSEQTHAIFPLGVIPPKQNSHHNYIIFDYVTTFYNSPLVSYFHVNLITKLSFIPNRTAYIINDLEKSFSFYNTFYYFVKHIDNIWIIFFKWKMFIKDASAKHNNDSIY